MGDGGAGSSGGSGGGDGSAGGGDDGTRGAFSFPFAEHAAASHCWKHTAADWQVRGATYLSDSIKVPSRKSIGDCVGVELFGSRVARIDNVGARPAGHLARLSAEKGLASPFHLVCSLQFPGPPYYSVAMVFELPFTAADFASQTAHDDDDYDDNDDGDSASDAVEGGGVPPTGRGRSGRKGKGMRLFYLPFHFTRILLTI